MTNELIYCPGCDSTHDESTMEYNPELDMTLCPDCF